jgi:hypothetical protein
MPLTNPDAALLFLFVRHSARFTQFGSSPAGRGAVRVRRLKWHTLCRLVTLVAVCLLPATARADDGLA